jgi:mRNA-degrading endonuclease toxin of MazEF toxin-antitoxin module
VPLDFLGVAGELATEQMRSLDRSRFVRHIGYLDKDTAERLSNMLVEMFRL